jgi:protein-tyrosine-phosphatase
VAGDAGAAGGTVRILVVCSANQCRSPMTAGLLAQRALAAGFPVEERSMGAQAYPGLPATPPTIDAARKLGVDLTAHASAPLDADVVRRADLVLALERRHVQDVVVADPSAFPRTFTLKELVRRGRAVGGRRPDQPVGEWLATLHEGRRPSDLLGISTDDDVADPTGSKATDHHTTAEEVDALSAEVLGLLFGR